MKDRDRVEEVRNSLSQRELNVFAYVKVAHVLLVRSSHIMLPTGGKEHSTRCETHDSAISYLLISYTSALAGLLTMGKTGGKKIIKERVKKREKKSFTNFECPLKVYMCVHVMYIFTRIWVILFISNFRDATKSMKRSWNFSDSDRFSINFLRWIDDIKVTHSLRQFCNL